MARLNNLIRISIIFGVVLLVYGCSESHVEIEHGVAFSDYGSQFKVLRAERYTQSRKEGEYTYYDEVVFVLLEWKCLKESSQQCVVGGSEFSLYNTSNNEKIENITFTSQVINQFGISIPESAYNCCNLMYGGDVSQVYLLFNVACYRDLVLRYYDYLGDSQPIYYIKLPGRVQCKR